jgi:hypothetical protein
VTKEATIACRLHEKATERFLTVYPGSGRARAEAVTRLVQLRGTRGGGLGHDSEREHRPELGSIGRTLAVTIHGASRVVMGSLSSVNGATCRENRRR